MTTPIKSLHLIASREMGGAERWFLRFLAAMARRDQPVEAVVRRGSDLDLHHQLGVPTRSLPFRTVWDPLSRFEVSRLIAASDAPIVQTYMGRATRLTHLKPGRGKIHISRLGGYYALHPFRHAHAWIGNTKGLCDWMVAQGLPASKVFHIYNFADRARPVAPETVAALRAEHRVAAGDWLLMSPGRFIGVKGHATLLDAFARLPREIDGRRPRLVLVGDGPLRERLEQQARELGIFERVLWAGWQQDPAPWFHLADMIVFPSRDAETLGNVILEAWAYAKPLVATAFRGAREIARHGEDAWVVPCDDAPALAAGIETLMRDPALQQSLVARGSRRVSVDFGEGPIVAQYADLYARLAG